jgi:hypothetical protein
MISQRRTLSSPRNGGIPPYSQSPPPGDVFVARLAPNGGSFDYSTFLGGVGSESGTGIVTDASGSAYVTGVTAGGGSSDFPTTAGSFQPMKPGATDAFVTKFSPSGSTLIYSTYLGGQSYDESDSIAVDSVGNAYVTGITDQASIDFPILNASQAKRGGANDAFVTKLNANGSALVYSTFLGGEGVENQSNSSTFGLPHIAVDAAGRAHVVGWTGSQDFPTTPDAFQRALHGPFFDAFVVKLGAGAVGPGLSLEAISPNHGGNSGTVTTRVHGAGFVSGMTIKLARAGQPDIVAYSVTVESTDGDLATASFDLRGGLPGLLDLVATNPDGKFGVLPDAFTIEAGGKPIIWSDVVGGKLILASRPATFTVVVGNRGNTDALGVMLFIGGLPRDATVQPRFEIISPTDPSIDWSKISLFVDDPKDANAQVLPLFVPIVRAGQSIPFRITLSVPTGRLMTLSASAGGPFFELGPDQAVTELTRVPSDRLSASFNPCNGPGSECFDCATSFLSAFPGPLGCAAAIVNVMKQAVCSTANGDQTFSVAQAVLGATLNCGAVGLKTLTTVLNIIRNGLGAVAGCSKCFTGKELGVGIASAFDPNDKVGSDGVGEPHYLTGEEPLRYMIFFENKPDATAPAHEVVITDQLDPNLDLTTFQPGAVAFGERQAFLKPDGSQFSTSVDLRPEKNLLVRISVGLNPTTRVLTWRFTSIDPATGEMPEDVQAGFLPPNRIPPEGDGDLFFTIMPKAGLASGTEIRNRASIIFDFNESINTPEWLNTIDNSKPTSHVTQLDASQPSVIFNVNWAGTDTGSGVQSYTIFVSVNGGPFTPWISNTTATSGFFPGQPSKTYAFYSVARDQTGNIENAKTSAETTTTTTSSFSNSVDDPRFFVWQHYLDFLNREPDQGGWDYWTSQITQCGSDPSCIRARRIDVSNAFFYELEYQQTAAYVFRLYRAAFGNNQPFPNPDSSYLNEAKKIPSYVAFSQDRSRLIGSANLAQDQLALANLFVSRSEFLSKYPSSLTLDQFVDAVIAAIKSDDGVDLSSQRSPLIALGNRSAVLYRIVDDNLQTNPINNRGFVDAEYNRSFVASQYFGYLRRDADIGGFLFWLGQVNSGPLRDTLKQHAMVCSFITSAEYQLRFGSVVTHTNAECPQ